MWRSLPTFHSCITRLPHMRRLTPTAQQMVMKGRLRVSSDFHQQLPSSGVAMGQSMCPPSLALSNIHKLCIMCKLTEHFIAYLCSLGFVLQLPSTLQIASQISVVLASCHLGSTPPRQRGDQVSSEGERDQSQSGPPKRAGLFCLPSVVDL